MNEKNHEKTSYAEYEELVDRSIFGNPYSQDSIIWKDKYVVKQGLELLWYAKRFTLSCGERKYVYLNYEIRHKLMRLEVADVETALRCISAPPGCGRTRIWFAERGMFYTGKEQHIYKATISADDVIAYVDACNEYEILQDNSVMNIEELPLESPSEEFMEIKSIVTNQLDTKQQDEEERRLNEYFERWYRSQQQK